MRMTGTIFLNLTISGFIVLIFHCICLSCSTHIFPDLKFDFNVPDVLKQNDYSSETHTVTTDDGYILSLYRIPSPRRQPILLLHSLLSDSTIFFFAKNNSLPFLLANENYDVWLGNFRGTVYSKDHLNYTWNDVEYWDWSWNEMALYDIPAFTKYIYQLTDKKILSIGYSMGTTTLAALLSTYPKMNEYMIGAFFLAPSIYMSRSRYLTETFFYSSIAIQDLHYASKSVDVHIILNEVAEMLRKGCSASKEAAMKCLKVVSNGVGDDISQLPEDDTSLLIVQNYPRITSIHTLAHYGEIVDSGKFQQYDWGIKRNFHKYKSKVPPLYNLSAITVPIAIFYGANDYLSTQEDVDQLWDEINDNCKYLLYIIPYKKFNHIDFVFAKNVKTLFYDKLLEIIRDFIYNKV